MGPLVASGRRLSGHEARGEQVKKGPVAIHQLAVSRGIYRPADGSPVSTDAVTPLKYPHLVAGTLGQLQVASPAHSIVHRRPSSVSSRRMGDGDLAYWRSRCGSLESENASLKADLATQAEEFAEFEASSKQLEAELERQCEQAEAQVRELSAALERAAGERERLELGAGESRRTIQRLEREVEGALGERDELRKAIRELEQANDDLERAKRNAVTSIEDLERNMNEMIERNALLENEVDEKESLKSQYQRLLDETRELKEELKVQELRKKPSSETGAASRVRAATTRPEPMDTTGTGVAASTRPTKGVPRSMTVDLGSSGGANGGLITPNGRVTALNIVGDLLRKVPHPLFMAHIQ